MVISSFPSTSITNRSVGRFLCNHPITPTIEDIHSLSNRDIRQATALRVLITLHRQGTGVQEDPVETFDQHAGLAINAYKWTRSDELRRRYGRGKTPRPLVSSLDTVPIEAVADIDPFEAVEHRVHLEDVAFTGLPGISAQDMTQVIDAMRSAQIMKDAGVARIPASLRQRIHRLPKKTGLTLDTALL